MQEDRKRAEKQNFLALRALVRSSYKVLIEARNFFFRQLQAC